MHRFSQIFAWQILALILLASAIALIYAASHDAATFDESAHIPAGYSYVRFLDYRLNHEHPPLVKVLSGIPLLFMDLRFPTDSTAWTTNVNGQWEAGSKFFYSYGNDADKLIFMARLGPVFLTLLLVFFLYIFARRFLSPIWALLPTFLFALSPNVLAHGHLVTTDMGATFGVLFSFYFLFSYFKNPSKQNLVWVGLAFGVAELMKFSNILLAPIFIILLAIRLIIVVTQAWPAHSVKENIKSFLKNALMEYGRLAIVFIICFVLIYLVYALFTINYPQELLLRDMHSVIGNFQPAFLRNIAFTIASVDILKPLAVYTFGVFSALQRTAGGNAAFFLGELSGKGWWYYFPVVYALKETIPVLTLLILTLYLAIRKITWRLPTFFAYLRSNFEIFSIIFFIGFYWLNSMISPLNIGIRHILPTLPLIYILITITLKKWLSFTASTQPLVNFGEAILYFLRQLPKALGKYVFLVIMLIWFVFEVLIISPNYISYFNEFVGTNNGYEYVTDSNYDWGQDLYRLKNWVDEQNKICTLMERNGPCGIDKIAVDYFGGGSPKYTLGDCDLVTAVMGKTCAENWWSSRGNPKDQGIEWLAISTNTMSGALGKPLSGFERKPEDEYRWLQQIRDINSPDARAGYSIFIYKL